MKLTDAQDKLFSALLSGQQPSEAAAVFGWSRQWLSVLMSQLAEHGLLRAAGDLPQGANTATYPSRMWASVTGTMTEFAAGADAATLRRVMTSQAKAGLLPPGKDPRRSEDDPMQGWTGQAYRVVEWKHGEYQWHIQGILEVRSDGKPARQAAPTRRSIVVTDTVLGKDYRFSCQRGAIISIRIANDHCIIPSTEAGVGLTLILAWVMESRALLSMGAIRTANVLMGWEK